MNRHHFLHCIILPLFLALLPVAAGNLLRAQQPNASGVQSKSALWRSETTGKEYRVQMDKDRFYAEWVNIPPESVKQGAYIRSECRRVGSKWIGTTRVNVLCPVGEGAKEHVVNTCRLQFRIEINSIRADRIEGRGETLKRFDCKSCKVDETGWGDFVWVPKTTRAH